MVGVDESVISNYFHLVKFEYITHMYLHLIVSCWKILYVFGLFIAVSQQSWEKAI